MENTLARQFETLWQVNRSPPDVFDFISNHPTASIEEKLEIVRVDQTCARDWEFLFQPNGTWTRSRRLNCGARSGLSSH